MTLKQEIIADRMLLICGHPLFSASSAFIFSLERSWNADDAEKGDHR
jgi:hypothetical protein